MVEDVERDPMSSVTEFEDFMEGTVWQDMKYEINLWLDGARDGLEDQDAGEKEIYRNQGRADACRRFLSVPEVLRDSLLIDREQRASRDESFRGGIDQSTPTKGDLE